MIHASRGILNPRMIETWYRRKGKRLLDFVIALTGMVVFWPLMLIIAVVIGFRLGRPVIFRQQRPGLQGRPFTLYKFRTMSNVHDTDGNLLPDSARLTPIGRFLRSTSLDELPELFNVVKGDMSLVGPRPWLTAYLDRYTSEQMRRHEVRPGITGWAQINGRNALSWNERLEMDVWYVDHVSLWLDVRILLLTLFKVLKREGIHQDGHATTSEFMGTE